MADIIGPDALDRPDLLADVIHHSRLAFASGWMKLDEAQRGDLNLRPPADMRPIIAKDYAAMQGMIFGDGPTFEEVMASIDGIAESYAERKKRH